MLRHSNTAVRLTVVPALAAAFLAGCGGGEDETAYCVDENDSVVDNSFCDDDRDGAYFWYFGGIGSAKKIAKGTKMSSGSKISTLDRAALAARGGFGSGKNSSSGVGKGYSSGGGGFFSGGG